MSYYKWGLYLSRVSISVYMHFDMIVFIRKLQTHQGASHCLSCLFTRPRVYHVYEMIQKKNPTWIYNHILIIGKGCNGETKQSAISWIRWIPTAVSAAAALSRPPYCGWLHIDLFNSSILSFIFFSRYFDYFRSTYPVRQV